MLEVLEDNIWKILKYPSNVTNVPTIMEPVSDNGIQSQLATHTVSLILCCVETDINHWKAVFNCNN